MLLACKTLTSDPLVVVTSEVAERLTLPVEWCEEYVIFMAIVSFPRKSSHALGGLSVELASELTVVANITVGADVPEGSSTIGRPGVAGQVLGAVGCLALIGQSCVDAVFELRSE